MGLLQSRPNSSKINTTCRLYKDLGWPVQSRPNSYYCNLFQYSLGPFSFYQTTCRFFGKFGLGPVHLFTETTCRFVRQFVRHSRPNLYFIDTTCRFSSTIWAAPTTVKAQFGFLPRVGLGRLQTRLNLDFTVIPLLLSTHSKYNKFRRNALVSVLLCR